MFRLRKVPWAEATVEDFESMNPIFRMTMRRSDSAEFYESHFLDYYMSPTMEDLMNLTRISHISSDTSSGSSDGMSDFPEEITR